MSHEPKTLTERTKLGVTSSKRSNWTNSWLPKATKATMISLQTSTSRRTLRWTKTSELIRKRLKSSRNIKLVALMINSRPNCLLIRLRTPQKIPTKQYSLRQHH